MATQSYLCTSRGVYPVPASYRTAKEILRNALMYAKLYACEARVYPTLRIASHISRGDMSRPEGLFLERLIKAAFNVQRLGQSVLQESQAEELASFIIEEFQKEKDPIGNIVRNAIANRRGDPGFGWKLVTLHEYAAMMAAMIRICREERMRLDTEQQDDEPITKRESIRCLSPSQNTTA